MTAQDTSAVSRSPGKGSLPDGGLVAGSRSPAGARGRFFWSQVVLLMAVVVPLSLAERQYAYLGLTIAAVVTAAWRRLAGKPPLVSRSMGYKVVLTAFAFLVVEMTLLGGIPVMALSHFLVLVCVTWLLQAQAVREQGQYFILCLLLLVVTSIVSGDLLFPFVLAVFLLVGLHVLVRFHLVVEQSRTERHNQLAGGRAMLGSPGGRGSTAGLLVTANLAMSAVAVVLFVLSPRVGAGMLGRLDGRAYTDSVTGLARTLSFDRVGAIHLSDQPVMTARVEDGLEQAVRPDHGEPYFRGAVFDQYTRRTPPRGSFWEWVSASPGNAAPADRVCRADDENTDPIQLLPAVDPVLDVPLIKQQYWLQPGEHHFLFTMYPALEIRSKQFSEVRKRIGDQVLQVYVPRVTAIHYEVVSAAATSPCMLRRLDQEREAEDVSPRIILPEPRVPREAEIRALIASLDEKAGTSGSPADPENRKRFVNAAMAYLQSSAFGYTLEPSPVEHGREPIGDFLLTEHRGHCEYFASALVLMCQYRGIPARLATGFLGGDYNAVGGYYVVRQRHAHAWAEVFLPGSDWVRYDPTPPAGRYAARRSRGLGKYLDYLQFQWSNQVVGYDDTIRQAMIKRFTEWLRRPAGYQPTWRGTLLAFVSEMIFWRSQLSLNDRLMYYAFTVMVTVLVVLVGYVIVAGIRILVTAGARRWGANRRRGPGVEAEFYARFCRRLDRLGLCRRPSQTPAEFARELAGRWPQLAGASEVVQSYYEVAFGGQKLSPQRQERIEAFLRELAGLDRRRFAQADAASTGQTAG